MMSCSLVLIAYAGACGDNEPRKYMVEGKRSKDEDGQDDQKCSLKSRNRTKWFEEMLASGVQGVWLCRLSQSTAS